jgi:ketosteroid isomerase-like protein
MKRAWWLMVMVLATSLALAQAPGGAKTTTKPASPAKSGTPAAPPKPANPLASVGVEQQVALQEVHYRDAAVSGNAKFMEKVFAPGYVGTSPDGLVTDRTQAVDGWKRGAIKYESMSISDMKVRAYPNVAVVNARAELKGRIDERDISGAYQYTRVWLKTPSGWQVIAFHASRLGK